MTKMPKLKENFYHLNEKAAYSLAWAPGNIPLAIIESLPEDKNVLKVKEHVFKPSNSNDEIQKKLVLLQEENNRVHSLPLIIEGNKVIIGTSLTSTMKVIDDQLCILYGGGFMLFNDFVNT
jgi:hypothetical protein